MDQKALFVFALIFEVAVDFFVKIGFFIKVEIMLQFHKLEDFLSLFISVYLCVILL